MWITRFVETALSNTALQRPVLVVTGARQTGKTSLLQKLFPKHHFLSLDLPVEAEAAETEPDDFLSRHPTPLIIDEVQYAPRLFRHLKQWVDKRRLTNGQFLLSGSQKFPLMKGIADSLAGRVAIFELETLSFREIQSFDTSISIPQILVRGGFPELYARPELDHSSFYRDYVATYLERDVRSISQIGSLRDFERFLRACALRTGQLLNKAELARDVGINPSTANEWLSILEASNQVTLLEPWFSNRTKSIVKSPKLYLNDTGLLSFLLNIQNEIDLSRSPLIGAIWETMVFSEMRKRLTLDRPAAKLFFWRNRTHEVDFLIHSGGRFSLFEAKWTESPQPSAFLNMNVAAKQIGPDKVEAMSVISRAPFAHTLDHGRYVTTLSEPLPKPTS